MRTADRKEEKERGRTASAASSVIIAAALIFNSDRWLLPLLLRSFNRSSVRWLCREGGREEDGGIITTASYSAAEATLRLGECGNAERQKKDGIGLAGQGYCPLVQRRAALARVMFISRRTLALLFSWHSFSDTANSQPPHSIFSLPPPSHVIRS